MLENYIGLVRKPVHIHVRIHLLNAHRNVAILKHRFHLHVTQRKLDKFAYCLKCDISRSSTRQISHLVHLSDCVEDWKR